MDGPSTNWKFYDQLVDDRKHEDPDMPSLLNIGSCSLHVVHGGFKYGATSTGWKLDSVLRSLWYVFENAPARREDYETITGSTVYPLRFCATRWLEDIPVAERAIQIWPSIIKYVKKTVAGPKSKVPAIQSFQNLRDHVQDPLIIAKLQFFISIAKILQPFLKKFQTDAPMLPFLAQELHTILQTVLAKFIKPAVMEEATTVAKVANIDVTKKENVVAPKKVDIGFASKMAVQKAKESKTVSPLQILEFQNECVEFLQKLASKLLERCPLQYPVVRYLVSLDPAFIANKPDTAISYFSSLLQKLISCKIREPDACDIILQQYKAWLSEVKRYQKEEFANYNPLSADKGLDVFFYEYIGDKPQYKELFGTVKDLLILSHGQSSIERGFSDNKDILSDNMNPETLVAFRRAHDGLKSEKKQIYECVTKNLLEHCSHAYHRYRSHLGEKKGTRRSN